MIWDVGHCGNSRIAICDGHCRDFSLRKRTNGGSEKEEVTLKRSVTEESLTLEIQYMQTCHDSDINIGEL